MKWLLEFVWWIITAVLAFGITYPIVSDIDDYHFLIPNIVFIVVFVTAARHIFLLKHTLISDSKILKIALIVLCLPILAYLFQYINNFQTFLDNLDDTGWDVFFGEKPHLEQLKMYNYMRSEMIFFGTAAVITSILLPIRMIISIWRQWNRGTV